MPSVSRIADATADPVITLPEYFVRYKWPTMFGCGSAFVSGVLVILLIEALLLMFLVSRSMEKKQRPVTPHSSSVSVIAPDDSFVFTLQGGVWITPLPPGDIKKMYTRREKALREKAAKDDKNDQDKGSKDSKSKRDILKDYVQITPVWRHARLHGRILHLSAAGIKESILLQGCEILAVSGASESTRKWAKKYPIKIHHRSRVIYGGSYDCLLYLDTGWEKEAWCEVLRGAVKWQDDTTDSYFKLKKEFKEYILRVEAQFPFLNRINSGRVSCTVDENKVRIPKAEVNTSTTKRRLLWKRLTRRNLKSNRDSKSGDFQEDVKKASDDVVTAEEGSSRGTSSITASAGDPVLVGSASADDLIGARPLIQEGSSVRAESLRVASVTSRALNDSSSAPLERDTQPQLHQGETMEPTLLCVNSLFSRLFFDLYHSSAVVNRIRALLQRQLSKVPTPSYIGKVNCTHLDLGNSPPLARNMSFLPVDSEGAWGLEADLEYYGGAILTIETRIDVRDSSSREKVVAQGLEQSLAGAATADLLTKGLESLNDDFGIAVDEGISSAEQRNAGGTSSSSRPADIRSSEEGSRKGWMQSSITNVKAMMSRVAEQVPLALTIKVVQVKGTLQVRIKPPPSDRVWFSFTKMPTLELVPEPCIGEHKINSGPLGAFIVNQIKILLRETMVFPQFEDLSYKWMISEADNWLPRDAVPLAFVPEQVPSDQSNQNDRRESQLRREGSVDIIRVETQDAGVGPSKSLPGIHSQYSPETFTPPMSPSRGSCMPSTLSAIPASKESSADLTKPLLDYEAMSVEGLYRESEALSETPQIMSILQPGRTSTSDSETGNFKPETRDLSEKQAAKNSKRAKVLTFGKKMGTKLEEKRRSVLDKMRDRSQQDSEHSNE